MLDLLEHCSDSTNTDAAFQVESCTIIFKIYPSNMCFVLSSLLCMQCRQNVDVDKK